MLIGSVIWSVIVLTILCMPLAAYSQAASITLHVDRDVYHSGDTVKIFGYVEPVTIDEKVLIQVYNSKGTLSRIEPLSLNADGRFAYNYTIDGPLNVFSGSYSVLATYLGNTKELSFMFKSVAQEWESFPVEIAGKTKEIGYKISGAELKQ